MIESINNEKIKRYAKLKERKYRDLEDLYLISTPHLVEEALKCGVVKEMFLLVGEDNVYGDVTYVNEAVMRKLTSLNTLPSVVAVCNKKNDLDIIGNVLLLDGIQDPGNLGTILRSAVAFNIDTVILGNGTVDLYNEKVLRAAEGMHFKLNVFNANLNDIILKLKNDNYIIIGTKLTNGIELNNYSINNKFALVMGNEGRGVSSEILDLCDEFVYINMNDDCESLNVAIATSIILYEFNKATK